MEGFFLMEDHAKPVDDDSGVDGDSASLEIDPFDSFDSFDSSDEREENGDVGDVAGVESDAGAEDSSESATGDAETEDVYTEEELRRIPLPVEQREVTSILIRTADDEFGVYALFLPEKINEGDLESTLDWSNFRPLRAQKAAQAVNPVIEITRFLATFVGPLQWLLLALTIMICIVSAISILVGIYNSMSQRKHEIAVMRALGASRSKVMSIMLVESIVLACAGGLLGWLGGHLLNVSISPFVERQTGVGIGFFDLAPPTPIFAWLNALIQERTGSSFLPEWLLNVNLSPEILLIPGLIVLSVLVGIYPAVSAYRTDVAKALGK
jgi:putative ABC transport system permease protein